MHFLRYLTSDLPNGWKVRLSINGMEAMTSCETQLTVKVPGMALARHLIELALLDQMGDVSGVKVNVLPLLQRSQII